MSYHALMFSLLAVVVDSNGKSRGYGFVRFRLEEERERAMKEMQRYVGLGTNPIHVSLAQAKRFVVMLYAYFIVNCSN